MADSESSARDSLLQSRNGFVRIPLVEADRPPSELAVPQPIGGRYRVERALAIGTASVVLVALDEVTKRRVIVKTMRPDAVSGPPEALAHEVRRLRHALQTERRLLVRLRNAGRLNVPNPNDYVYDRNPAWEDKGLDARLAAVEPYLVLQYVEGVSLEQWIDADYPRGMPEALAVRLILPVIETLAMLHEPWRMSSGRTWHCIYQDLKPSNILVDPAGRAFLIDFGGCQIVVDGTPVLEGARTLGYSPPECEGPPRVLLACADVYTIGATLHHMLSGVDPRLRLGRSSVLGGGHLDPGTLPASVSPGLRSLVGRCLAARPSDRLADARRVVEILRTLAGP